MLTNQYEENQSQPWFVSDPPPDFTKKMLEELN
jgi:predicted FMN-binding regulatory protein PaiB